MCQVEQALCASACHVEQPASRVCSVSTLLAIPGDADSPFLLNFLRASGRKHTIDDCNGVSRLEQKTRLYALYLLGS